MTGLRAVAGGVARVVGRAALAELTLWIRWALRAVALVLVLAGAWSWWIQPAIAREVTRQREAVVREVRDAIPHPGLPDVRGWLQEHRQ